MNSDIDPESIFMNTNSQIDKPRISILGMLVDDIDQDVALDKIVEWSAQHEPKLIRITNVHSCMESYDDHIFRKQGNSVDLSLIDSRILFWTSKLLGWKSGGKLQHGANIMASLCAKAENRQVKIGLYGGTPASLSALISKLKNKYPNLDIGYHFSPPFRPLDEKEMTSIAHEISDSGVQLLFVGIGCPKQEKWMLSQRDRLGCVMIGVGTAFDILSGAIEPSPAWVHKAGLEWLWRTVKEPARIGRRTLKHNPRFVGLLILQLCRIRRFN